MLDARAARVLLRANAAASPPAALAAALSVDPPLLRDDFFRHLFSDTDAYPRADAPVICLRLELLPALLQRAVASAMAIHSQRISGAVLRFCLERARAHVTDKAILQTLSRVTAPGEPQPCTFPGHLRDKLGRLLADRLHLTRGVHGHHGAPSFLQASPTCRAVAGDAEMEDAGDVLGAEADSERRRVGRCSPAAASGSRAEVVGEKRQREGGGDEGTTTKRAHDSSNNVEWQSAGEVKSSIKVGDSTEAELTASMLRAAPGGEHADAPATLERSSHAVTPDEARARADAALSAEDHARVKSWQTKIKALRAHAAQADVPPGVEAVLLLKPLDQVSAHAFSAPSSYPSYVAPFAARAKGGALTACIHCIHVFPSRACKHAEPRRAIFHGQRAVLRTFGSTLNPAPWTLHPTP